MENGDVSTYAEAFPPLGGGASGGEGEVTKGTSPWGQVKSIPASTVTQMIQVPVEERRYKSSDPTFGGENQQAAVVREIMSKTGCKIEMSQSKDLSLTIMMTGKPVSVRDAQKMIMTELHTKFTVEVRVPKAQHGMLLGKQAANIKQLEQSTNTKISVPRQDDSSEIVRISGNKEGVGLARQHLIEFSEDLSKQAKEMLSLESEFHPFISGPNNCHLSGMNDSFGVKVNVPPFSSGKNDIIVTGEKEGVAKAVTRIKQLYQGAKRNYTTVSVEVRKTQHRHVFGGKGQGIQEILEKTGIYVDVPQLGSKESTITLRGPQDKMGEALTLVYSKANSVVSDEVSAPSWLHRFIIGRGGENIKNITQDLHVTVNFPKEGDSVIIEGPPDEVQVAKESLENFTEGLMATMVFVEVHIDQKYHPHIIGKKGANVTKIKEETCTSISIPSDKQKCDVIRIEGDPKGVAAAKKMIMEMATKLANESTVTVEIEQKWHKMVIGANGENMKELRDRFPGVHVAFPEPGRRSNLVTLRGPTKEVDKCSTFIGQKAKNIADSNYKSEVKIFRKFHGSIIGRGGATLKKIRDETDTKIEMPREGTDSDIIIITGKKENVDKAKRQLQDIEKQMASIVEVTIKIPHKQHNAIIGPHGKLIRSVKEDCGGIRIHFPPTGSSSDEVVLHGPKEDVSKAKTMLLEMATQHAVENFTIELKCKPEYHRFLIGKGGAKIRKVRDQFGARVIFPQKGSEEEEADVILIIGVKENVLKTKEHLEKLMKDLDDIVEEGTTVDPKYHRHFVQRRGHLIHEIAEENGGVVIIFPRGGGGTSGGTSTGGSDKVIIKGAKQCVEGAKQAIIDVIEELEAQVTIECVIPRKKHRQVLGAKGSNVQNVTQDFNVTIKFPDRETPSVGGGGGGKSDSPTQTGASPDKVEEGVTANGEEKEGEEEETKEVEEKVDPRDVILISGRQENCESAKKALLDLVPVIIYVPVPIEYHRYIVGTRGQDIRSLAEKYRVMVDVPRAELQQDKITLQGPAQNCEEAKQVLERRVLELEAEKEERELRSYTEVLKINSKHHPNIIGRRGATINKIRDEHGVRIQLPEKDHTHSDEITIIGYEHQVHSAKDAILKIVRELEEQITDELEIDHRVHSRLIGAKGKAIAKVMETFGVMIRFPKDKSSSIVTITGLEENVEDTKEHLLLLTEEYMLDVIEKQEEKALMDQYTRRSNLTEKEKTKNPHSGFVVKEAPWSSGNEEFPAIGGPTTSQKAPTWGPSTLGPKLPN